MSFTGHTPRLRGDSRPAVKGVLGALVCGAASALFVMGLVKGGAEPWGNHDNQRTALLPKMQAHVKVQTHDHGALLLQATHSAPVMARQNRLVNRLRLASEKFARQQSFKQRQLAALRIDAIRSSADVISMLKRQLAYATSQHTRANGQSDGYVPKTKSFVFAPDAANYGADGGGSGFRTPTDAELGTTTFVKAYPQWQAAAEPTHENGWASGWVCYDPNGCLDPPPPPPANCLDLPNFLDSEGDSCAKWAANPTWCFGSPEDGVIDMPADYKNEFGVDPAMACCVCGGGAELVVAANASEPAKIPHTHGPFPYEDEPTGTFAGFHTVENSGLTAGMGKHRDANAYYYPEAVRVTTGDWHFRNYDLDGSYMVPEVTAFGSYSGSLPVLTPVTGDGQYTLPDANYSGPDPHEFSGVGAGFLWSPQRMEDGTPNRTHGADG